MYGVVHLMQYPEREDPTFLSLELFASFKDAEKRTRRIVKDFIEDYGEDFIEYATKESPVAIASNDEVTAYAYIAEVGGTVPKPQMALAQ